MAGELGLFFAGDVGWHDSVHSALSPLVAVSLNFVDAALDQAGVATGLLTERAQMLNEFLMDGGYSVCLPRGMFGIPDEGNGLFNTRYREVGCVAVSLLDLPSAARVVLIYPAMPASIDRVNQSGAAPAAVQAAGQILQVLPFPVAGASIGGEAVLHLLEGALVDEGFVIAGIFDAAQAGSADVEAIREHLVGMTALYGALRLFRGGAESQATVLQECGEAAQRHVRVGCVGVEGPPDMVGSLVVDGDLPGFATVDRRANIYVPDGSSSNGAAAADFLGSSQMRV